MLGFRFYIGSKEPATVLLEIKCLYDTKSAAGNFKICHTCT